MKTPFIPIPDALRGVDQSMHKMRSILAILPIAYLLGDAERVTKLLDLAITTTQELANHLQTAKDRSTR